MKLDTRLMRRKDIMTADMNGSAVTMDIATGKYYNLGETGGVIWNLLDQEKTVEEVITALTAEYNISKEQCEKEITPFLESLVTKGLLIVRN